MTIQDSVIGPNVTLEAGCSVQGSTLINCIVGRDVRVVRSTVRDSLVGDGAVIEGRRLERSVLDAGELARAR